MHQNLHLTPTYAAYAGTQPSAHGLSSMAVAFQAPKVTKIQYEGLGAPVRLPCQWDGKALERRWNTGGVYLALVLNG